MFEIVNETDNKPGNKSANRSIADQMAGQIMSLTMRHKGDVYLANTIKFHCEQCNRRYMVSYYNILANGNFELKNPVHTLTTYVREAEYEEDVTVTPIVAKKVCTECNNEMIVEFPVSLEYLLVILQAKPPDSSLYV